MRDVYEAAGGPDTGPDQAFQQLNNMLGNIYAGFGNGTDLTVQLADQKHIATSEGFKVLSRVPKPLKPELTNITKVKEGSLAFGDSGFMSPTDAFGFPFHPKYHATGSQTLKASSLVDRPFLVEKIVYEFSGSSDFAVPAVAFEKGREERQHYETTGGTFFILNQRKCANTTKNQDDFFVKELKKNISELDEEHEVNKKLVLDMIGQGKRIIPDIESALNDYFEEFEVMAVEMPLFEPISDEEDYHFKGYIDAVVATPDGKVHIFDWKTCSWGWDAKRRSEPMTTYQLTLYKHFYAIKHGIDPKMIETHFALLKRTAKKNRVEIFVEIERLFCLSQGCPDHILEDFANVDFNQLLLDLKVKEKETRHETVAFIQALGLQMSELSLPYLHKGATSSDILDTCLAKQMKDASDVVLQKIERLLKELKSKAIEHKYTPILGRSHGMSGEITSFGLIFLGFYSEWERNLERMKQAKREISFGKVSGAMGNYVHIDPHIEKTICKTLGLDFEPISTQVVPRDRHALFMSILGILGASMERLAVEVRNLSQSLIQEVAEGFGKDQTGSSAMPHKRNPILSENLTGLSRMIRAYVQPSLENVVLWDERDMSHSSVERITVEDSFHLACFGVKRITKVIIALPKPIATFL